VLNIIERGIQMGVNKRVKKEQKYFWYEYAVQKKENIYYVYEYEISEEKKSQIKAIADELAEEQ